jgi:oxygen-dependent protoporphyrinogen oxidase
MNLSRRSFIKWLVSAGGALACPFPVSGAGGPKGGRPPSMRSETNEVCHAVRDGYELPAPPVSEKRDVVIVGGGPSGLAAADHLGGADWLLLEKEGHLGGNAYTEEWQGLPYCTGSAWMSIFTPEVQGLVDRYRLPLKPIEGGDAACFEGKWIADFWTGREDNPAIEQLPYPDDVKRGMRRFCAELGKLDLKKDLKKLDRMSMGDLLQGHSAPLKDYWDAFGLSNWGADAASTSASCGVEAALEWPVSKRFSFEGGLGIASRKIIDHIPEAQRGRLLTGASAYRVRRDGKRVLVMFRRDGQDICVSAKAVIMAAPKFITRLLVEDLPPKQMEATGLMRYAPYLVHNLCFDRVVYNQAYDNFVVGAKSFTDFVPADFVAHGKGGDLNRKQVITVYSPLREEDRKSLLDDAAAVSRAQAAAEELAALFPGWADHLSEVRTYRRGHAMPMSIPGWYTDLQKKARKDHGRVFFAHSDSAGTNSDLAYAAFNGIEAAAKAKRLL